MRMPKARLKLERSMAAIGVLLSEIGNVGIEAADWTRGLVWSGRREKID
jgi:hypothetical protein